MPLPNHHLIHPRFEAHHRPVAERAMTITGRLLRPDETGTRDPVSGRTTFANPALVYEGPAKVKANAGSPSVQAERIVTVGGYLLVLPADCPLPHVRDVFEVDDGGDPTLQGAVLRVVDVPRNTLSFQRNIGCDIEQPTNRGG